jgi:hypothetical protein
MSDDWRLRIDLHEEDAAHKLLERLEALELGHDLKASFHDRIVVSRNGAEVFCYAGTREQVERAEKLIRSLADKHGWQLDCDLKRWHPSEEEWEDPDKPLPDSDAERMAERVRLMERERQEAEARGYPEFEVRIECASHHDAMQFVDKLREEGLSPVHRWKYLLVGALDEDSANALAERLRAEAPPGSEVTAEGTWKAIRAEQPSNPFAIFGGLGV